MGCCFSKHPDAIADQAAARLTTPPATMRQTTPASSGHASHHSRASNLSTTHKAPPHRQHGAKLNGLPNRLTPATNRSHPRDPNARSRETSDMYGGASSHNFSSRATYHTSEERIQEQAEKHYRRHPEARPVEKAQEGKKYPDSMRPKGFSRAN